MAERDVNFCTQHGCDCQDHIQQFYYIKTADMDFNEKRTFTGAVLAGYFEDVCRNHDEDTFLRAMSDIRELTVMIMLRVKQVFMEEARSNGKR